MFKKIVTELAYSPALAGSLGEYIKRLRSERSRRQIGLIFVLLALMVQFFATAFPPESANANDPELFIDGGIESIDDYLQYYDQNTKNIKDLLRSLGVTRSDIEAARSARLPSTDQASIWAMQNSRDDNSFAYTYTTVSGKPEIAYYRPVESSTTNSQDFFVGSAAQSNTWFAIARRGGNLITKTPEATSCSPWFTTSTNVPASSSWKNTTSCPDTLQASLTARAILSGSTSLPRSVDASDRIEYTLSLTNTGASTLTALPAINLEDVLEYARILDSGNGEYNYDTKMLGWTPSTLRPGGSLERRFIVQLLPSIPSTPRGQHIASSYDCTLQITFGTALSTPVSCPFVKSVESLTHSLPAMSKIANVAFGLTLLIVTLYFYLRSRQLLTELYIIRHNHLGGL